MTSWSCLPASPCNGMTWVAMSEFADTTRKLTRCSGGLLSRRWKVRSLHGSPSDECLRDYNRPRASQARSLAEADSAS